MENASAAFLNAVLKSMRPNRAAIGATVINLELLTAAERLQHEGYLRCEETNAGILALATSGARKSGRKQKQRRSDAGDQKTKHMFAVLMEGAAPKKTAMAMPDRAGGISASWRGCQGVFRQKGARSLDGRASEYCRYPQG